MARHIGVFDGLVKHCGGCVEVQYSVSTRFKKAFLKIEAQGDKYSPADGDVVDMDSIEDAELQPLLRQHKGAVIYGYHAGQNVIRVASPRIKNKTILGSPLLWGAVLGLALGFLCALLPDDIRNVIVNDVVSPVKTVTLTAHRQLQRGVRRAPDGLGGHRVGSLLRRHRHGPRQAAGVRRACES